MKKSNSSVLFVFTAGVVLLAAGTTVQAASTLTYTRNQASTLTDWGPFGATDIPQFDPLLGTLTQVDMALSGSMNSTMTIRTLNNTTTTVVGGSSFVLLSADFATLNLSFLETAFIPGVPFNISENDEVILTLAASGSDSTSLSAPGDDLSAFIGAGNLSYEWTALGGFDLQALGGNTEVDVTTFADAELEITYTYDETPIIPEPASATMVLLGLSGIAFLRNRRNIGS